MAAKMCAMTSAPPPASERMGEFVYPAQRAREVQAQFPRRRDDSSYREFDKMLERYENLVRSFDRARVSDEAWRAAGPGLCEERRAVAEAAVTVRRALAEEG